MTDHDQSLIHASGEPFYRTPLDLFDALDREFRFGVDAAADPKSALCAWFYGPGALPPEDAVGERGGRCVWKCRAVCRFSPA